MQGEIYKHRLIKDNLFPSAHKSQIEKTDKYKRNHTDFLVYTIKIESRLSFLGYKRTSKSLEYKDKAKYFPKQ